MSGSNTLAGEAPVDRPAGGGTAFRIMQIAGELLITVGVLILLFVVYQLFYTNVAANQAMNHARSQLETRWTPSDAGKAPSDPAKVKKIPKGEAFALMWIPRLGKNYAKPVLEGTKMKYLAQGLGHYEGSAMPGRTGNFAVAGHRATHGEPFRELDKLRPGDKVVIETSDMWYTYVVDRPSAHVKRSAKGVLKVNDGNVIVEPTDVEVVLPVPHKPGAKAKKKLITLTTCHPRWASYERMIVFGHLESQQPKSAGRPPALAP